MIFILALASTAPILMPKTSFSFTGSGSAAAGASACFPPPPPDPTPASKASETPSFDYTTVER